MAYGVYLLTFFVSFITTLFLMPKLIKRLKEIGITGIDVHKKNREKIPEMGGIGVVFGFLMGVFVYIGVQTFIVGNKDFFIPLFASATTILTISLIGIFDDIPRRKGQKQGLKQWQKPLISLIASIPLVAIASGVSKMSVPFFGIIEFGLIYPLILVPLIITFVSNCVNLLGGFNGLEGSMALVACLSIGIFGLIKNVLIVPLLMFPLAGAIFAFLKYNWYPAKIFPGDSFTYSVGAVIACAMIIGNIEKFGFFVLIPWIFEFVLKARGKFKHECFGKLQKDMTIQCREKGIYSLTHLVMKIGKFSERKIVIAFILVEIVFSLLGFLVSL